MDSIKYCNEVMARLETLMYQELSGMSYWKCEFVGTDFIRSRNIQGKNVFEIVDHCIKEITAAGIASDIAYKVGPDGVMLKLKVKNCIHLAKETLVKEEFGFSTKIRVLGGHMAGPPQTRLRKIDAVSGKNEAKAASARAAEAPAVRLT